jgi:serine/threonine protein kinase
MPLRCEPGAEPIPGHRLIDRLGGGGFGEVWKCACPSGGFKAIKVVYGDLAAIGDRTAEQELRGHRCVLDLHHPLLLAMERIEIVDGQLLVVMELADGSLADRARKRPIPREDLLGYMADAAAALDFLRDAHLQHLDVKPQNLLLVGDHAKVSDFGLVKDLRTGRPSTAASPLYSAPETFAGQLGRQCDQYSLAIVYQELLTGARPFTGTTPEQLANQHLSTAPDLTSLSPADRPVVRRALAKLPEERFPSCLEFVRALLDQTVHMNPTLSASEFQLDFLEPGLGRPALVIGLGGTGGAAICQIRRSLSEQFDSFQSGRARFLYVETDTVAIREAVDNESFDPSQVFPARLQRADQYERSRPAWVDAGWLKRLAADGPNGCRGLGRLAFAENVRALRQKIDADLAAVNRMDPTSTPRVVIVAGLGGGDGGMAIDVAYLARHLLRRFGSSPDVSGWFLLPPHGTDEQAIANAVAALLELRHFTKPETIYRARLDESTECLTTKDAPFVDSLLLPADTSADGLKRELLSPAAGNADGRTFGEARLVFPRKEILRHAARRLAADLVDRWTSATEKPFDEPVRNWVAQQWAALDLGPDAVYRRLRQTPNADGLIREWGTRLARPAATLIEQPNFRLAGAKCALRQLMIRVDHTRTQCARQPQMTAIYTALRRQLDDQLVDIELCRSRLADVADWLRGDETADSTGDLLPPDCESVADAASQLKVGDEDLEKLERMIQRNLVNTFGGLARACLTAADLVQTLGPTLAELAESLIAPRLPSDGAAQAFLARHPDPVAAMKELWNAAAPALAANEPQTTTVIAPEALTEIVRQALGSDVILTPSADEITVIRSVPRLPLTALAQLGPAAMDAYRRRKTAGDSPHSRVDLPFGISN